MTSTGLELIKNTLRIFRRALKKREKIVYDEKEDDIEYLKDNINELKGLKNNYFNKYKYHEHKVKYLGTDETIRYLFEHDDEDYNIYKVNEQYQSFSNKILLLLNKYTEKIRPELIKLMTKDHEVELNANLVFGSKANSNDECNVFIKTKSVDIDEIFVQLIKKYEDFKNIGLLLKGVESITYSFIKIIIENTFFESPDWIKNKKCTKTMSVFSILLLCLCTIKKLKTIQKEFQRLTILIGKILIFALNVLIALNNKDNKKVSHYYKSEFNKIREKQVILLMISDNEKQHYLALRRLNGPFLKKTGHSGECCLSCLKLFVIKLSSQKHKC